MKSETTLPEESLVLLYRQLAELVDCLQSQEDHWIGFHYRELEDLPNELSAHVDRISASISNLQCRVQESDYASLREWEKAESGNPTHIPHFSDSLRVILRGTKRVAHSHQLLAENVLAYVQGLRLLMQSAQSPTYTHGNPSAIRGSSLKLQG